MGLNANHYRFQVRDSSRAWNIHVAINRFNGLPKMCVFWEVTQLKLP
jgi:hypothetical protein